MHSKVSMLLALWVNSKYLSENGFFGPGSWYMNTELNSEYFKKAPLKKLHKPVLFIHAKYDRVCDTCHTSLADPMRENCSNLEEATIDCGHWMAQEKPEELNKILETNLVGIEMETLLQYLYSWACLGLDETICGFGFLNESEFQNQIF